MHIFFKTRKDKEQTCAVNKKQIENDRFKPMKINNHLKDK